MAELPSVRVRGEHLRWLGTESCASDVVGVLVGRKKDAPPDDGKVVNINALHKACKGLDAVILFFEIHNGCWAPAPFSKTGTKPYVCSPLMAANFFNCVRFCYTEDEQTNLLRSAEITIEGQPIEVR